jgi:predicted secreted protein
MATISVLNGTKMLVSIDGSVIGRATGATLDFTHSARDITTKDSGGWQEFLEGLRGATISTEHLYAEDEATGINEIQSLVLTTRIPCELVFGAPGDRVWSCDAWLTAFSVNAGAPEDNASFSATFVCSGPLTSAVT